MKLSRIAPFSEPELFLLCRSRECSDEHRSAGAT